MSKESSFGFESLKVHIYNHPNLRTFKDTSFVSNNDSNNHNVRRDDVKTVDFEEYLHTEHFSPSDDRSESLDYQEDEEQYSPQSKMSQEFVSDKKTKNGKILIEIGQNYTFADQMSSHRKSYNKGQTNANHFPLIKKDLLSNFYSLSHRNHSKNEKINKNIQEKNVDINSCTSYPLQIPSSHSKFASSSSISSSDSKQISLSDNEQDQGVAIYKSKEIQEEMFLKISEQTKQILRLEEKVYYFENFCKRLMKSQEQSQKVKIKIGKELRLAKKNLKQKSDTIHGLEQKLNLKEKQLQQLKIQHLTYQNQLKTHHNRTNSLTNREIQRKILVQRQNIQNAIVLETHNKALDEKYKTLFFDFKQMESRVFELQKQLFKSRKDVQTTKKKSKNIQNMNKILQKEVSELNVKIFQLETEMEKVTYDKYASNLVRIKNITSEAQRDPNLRIANMITEPFEVKETLNLAKI